MNQFEDFPTEAELLKQHESTIFPGSHDISESTHVGNIGLSVRRPTEGSVYCLFMKDGVSDEEEVAIIGGSTAEAEEVFAKATQILGMGLKLDEAKARIRNFIVDMHGGLQDRK